MSRTTATARSFIIRPATEADTGPLVALCGEHSTYERAAWSAEGKTTALRKALFGRTPLLHALIALIGTQRIGYATYTIDFSTWRAAPYLHLDCLFVRPSYRGVGVGGAFMARIAEEARMRGCPIVEWQTPPWNTQAVAFYRRLGATDRPKRRFAWPSRRPDAQVRAAR